MILLLHGQPGSARDWDGVVGAIGARARTVAIDRPGWARHSRPAGLDGNADAALAALDRVDAERAVVLGHSFGATVAAWLAVRNPERVSALVLVSPAANMASLNQLDRWLAAPIAGYLASAAAIAGVGAALRVAPVRRRITRTVALDERYLVAAGRRLLAPAAWRAFVHEQRVLVRELPALERRLGEIAAPTRIVAGTRDVVVPPASVRRLAEQIPGAALQWVDRAGHLLPLARAGALGDIAVAAATTRAGGPGAGGHRPGAGGQGAGRPGAGGSDR